MKNEENKELSIAIGARLRQFRESLGLSQMQFSELVHGTKRALQDNEVGNSAPNSKALYGLIKQGLDANWLIAGIGQMRLDHSKAPVQSKSHLDQSLLRFVIESMNVALHTRRCNLDSYKYAEIAAIYYDFCIETQRHDLVMAERLISVACGFSNKEGAAK